jgi:hypothetical protein
MPQFNQKRDDSEHTLRLAQQHVYEEEEEKPLGQHRIPSIDPLVDISHVSGKCQPSLSLSHQLMNILDKGETAVLSDLSFLFPSVSAAAIKSLNNGSANIKSNDYQSQLELWGEISNI